MQEFQNDFYQAVSKSFGHARLLSQRPRRPRAEHLRIRGLESDNARLVEQVKVLEQQVKKMAAAADSELNPAPELCAVPDEVVYHYHRAGDDQSNMESAAEHAQRLSSELDSEDDIGPEEADFGGEPEELDEDADIDRNWDYERSDQPDYSDD
jgi:hypothetical protein